MKNKINYVLSIVIPLVILSTVYFVLELNDENSLFISDLYYQYQGLLVEFKNNLLNGNIFYSFSKGLGGNMASTYAYYLSSPFNYLVVFFDINFFIMVSILLKISFSCTTMYSYLRYNLKKDSIFLVAFSCMYSLSTFVLANYFQIMWLDIFLFAPLVLMGIDKLLNENKKILYAFSLSFVIISNFYLGFMVCSFSVIYFLYKLFLKGFNKKDIISFIIISILAGLISSFVLIPNIFNFIEAERSTIIYGNDLFSLSDFLSKFFITNITGSNLLNQKYFYLYFGVINLILIPSYFFNNKFSVKERIATGIVFLIFLLSISLEPLNTAWHLFSPPNCFNGRYMFLFIIFSIYISCKSFFEIENVKVKNFIISILIVLSLFIISLFGTANVLYLLISFILLVLYLVMLIVKNSNIYKLSFIVLILEIFFSSSVLFISYVFIETEEVLGRRNEATNIIEYVNENADTFYRYANFNSSRANDPLSYNYIGAEQWLSTIGTKYQTLCAVGMLCNINTFEYTYSPVLGSLLGIDYFASNYAYLNEKPVHSTKYSVGSGILYGVSIKDNYLFYNDNALSVGYMIKDDSFSYTRYILENQNQFIKSLSGIESDVYENINYEVIDDKTFSFEITNSNDLAIDLNINGISNAEKYAILIENNGKEVEGYSNQLNTYFVGNKFEVGDEITIFLTTNGNELNFDNMKIYSINEDILESHINSLKEEQLNIDIFEDGYIKGDITVIETGTMYFTIPYEEGWDIYVDGKKVDYFSVYGYFLGIELEEGYHEIKMKFTSPGFNFGIIASTLSVIVLIGYIIYNKKKAVKDCN